MNGKRVLTGRSRGATTPNMIFVNALREVLGLAPIKHLNEITNPQKAAALRTAAPVALHAWSTHGGRTPPRGSGA